MATPETKVVTHYLFVAYYNRNKWNALDWGLKEAAHEAAEEWIPEKPENGSEPDKSRPVVGPDGKGTGNRMLQSFASNLFQALQSPEYLALRELEKRPETQALANMAQDYYVDRIYASKPPQPPVGWMEIVPAAKLAEFIHHMAPFWKMYDVEVYELNKGWTAEEALGKVPPLNNDPTTHEVYMFMTPRNWS